MRVAHRCCCRCARGARWEETREAAAATPTQFRAAEAAEAAEKVSRCHLRRRMRISGHVRFHGIKLSRVQNLESEAGPIGGTGGLLC
ncbi:unnamed protein product [Lampetra fluviatilis]